MTTELWIVSLSLGVPALLWSVATFMVTRKLTTR